MGLGQNLGVALRSAGHDFPDRQAIQYLCILANRGGFSEFGEASPVGQDAQVLDGLSVGEIVTGAAKGNTQVLAQAHAVAGELTPKKAN